MRQVLAGFLNMTPSMTGWKDVARRRNHIDGILERLIWRCTQTPESGVVINGVGAVCILNQLVIDLNLIRLLHRVRKA